MSCYYHILSALFSDLVIFNQISSKFHILYGLCFDQTFAQNNLEKRILRRSNMGFVRRTISKMANKMATAYHLACCGHSNLVILIGFLSNYIYGLLR